MERQQKQKIIEDLAKKMVFLTGPRQVGKSWLAKDIAGSLERRLPGRAVFQTSVASRFSGGGLSCGPVHGIVSLFEPGRGHTPGNGFFGLFGFLGLAAGANGGNEYNGAGMDMKQKEMI